MSTELTIRLANKNDRAVFWDWYNDPLRCILFPKARLVDKSRCLEWFDRILESKDEIIFIGTIDIIRIGAVRFQRKADGMFEAFVTLKSAYLRRGLLPKFLQAAAKKLREQHEGNGIYFRVPQINPASRGILEREGYHLEELSDGSLRWEQRW